MILVCDCGQILVNGKSSTNCNILVDTEKTQPGKCALDMRCNDCGMHIISIWNGLPDNQPALEMGPNGPRVNVIRKAARIDVEDRSGESAMYGMPEDERRLRN